MLRETKSGAVIADVKKHGEALPLELDISLRTYLPDGRLLDLGPDSSNIAGLTFVGNTMSNMAVGIAINNPNCFHGRKFTNEVVKLDGKRFVKCTFTNCTLVYAASAPVFMYANLMDNPRFAFEGSAQATVEFMAALYRDGAAPMVEATFDAIRGKTPFPTS